MFCLFIKKNIDSGLVAKSQLRAYGDLTGKKLGTHSKFCTLYKILHRVHLHVKVPGWMLNLNALVTKKLPKFFSRLNEMSGGREKVCLVSGSLWRILKFSRTTFLIARFCGW